ncbi:hypothetical protein HDV00_004859 [Rhizophlyctis rosea]|nr:hypothetical protein HDV00_004859 [Rhizophlyctis rosea]
MEKTTTPASHRPRHRLIVISVASIAIFILVLGLGLGLGLRHHSNDDDSQQQQIKISTNDSQFILDTTWDVHAPPTIREYKWNITDSWGAPDGVPRRMLVINNQFPGPLIEANENDTIVVTIHNDLENATSIHWHGMYQNGTNYMDGSLGITECGIPPGQSFTYNFTIRGQWGTYWYHAHASTQYSDGIVGPLIIHSANDPLNGSFDQDMIVMVSDWYHDFSQELLVKYLNPPGIEGTIGTEPVPESGVINGRGVFGGGGTGAQLQFQEGKSVDGHDLSVVEADGTAVVPVQVHRAPVHVAQRYSVIITTNQTASTYPLRAKMNTNCFAYIPPTLNPTIYANITYTTAPSTSYTITDWSDTLPNDCIDLSESMLIPQLKRPAPKSTTSTTLSYSFQTSPGPNVGEEVNYAYINSISYMPQPSSPTLFQYHSSPSTLNFAGNLVIPLPNITTHDIIVNSQDKAPHPFHFAWTYGLGVQQGEGRFTGDSTNLEANGDVLRRDVVVVPAFGHVVLRFVVDNPGVWAFHCHIGWHMEAGLLMQFAALPDQMQQLAIPQQMQEFCSTGVGQSGTHNMQ